MPDDWGMGPTTTSGGGSSTATASGGNAFTDWLKENAGWLSTLGQLGVGAYVATKQPTYHQVPLSPEQSALYQRYLKASDNPATKYNAGISSDLARSELGRIGPTLPWNRTSPMSMAYQGLNAPTLAPSGMPQGTNADYYNGLIRQSVANQKAWEGQSSGATTTPTAPAAGGSQGENSVTGDPFGHLSAPGGSSGDPFATLPTGTTGGGDGNGLGQLGGWLAQHPEITKLGVNGIASAIGAAFGLPAGIAFRLAASWLMGKMGGQNGQYTGNPNPTGAEWTTVDPNGIERTPVRTATGPEKQGAIFINNQQTRLGSDPGQFAPEFGARGQPGFGYGWTYDQFYGGGAGGSGNDAFSNNTRRRQMP